MNRSFVIASAMICLTASVRGARADVSVRDGSPSPNVAANAKDLFYQPEADAGGAITLALRHQLVLRRGCVTRCVPDAFPFESGDRIRLVVQVNHDGYLYVLHRGSSGQWKFLFPDTASGVDLAVHASEETVLPRSGWYEFDRRAGREELHVFFSVEPIREFQLAHSEAGRLFEVAVCDADVQAVVERHRGDVRRGTAKDIQWTDDSAPTEEAKVRIGAPDEELDTTPGPSAYAASTNQRRNGVVIHGLSLLHVR